MRAGWCSGTCWRLEVGMMVMQWSWDVSEGKSWGADDSSDPHIKSWCWKYVFSKEPVRQFSRSLVVVEGLHCVAWPSGQLLHFFPIPPPVQAHKPSSMIEQQDQISPCSCPWSSTHTCCFSSSCLPKMWLIILHPCAPRVSLTGQQCITAKLHKSLRGLTGTTKGDAFDRQKSALVSVKTESHQSKQKSASRHSPYL